MPYFSKNTLDVGWKRPKTNKHIRRYFLERKTRDSGNYCTPVGIVEGSPSARQQSAILNDVLLVGQ